MAADDPFHELNAGCSVCGGSAAGGVLHSDTVGAKCCASCFHTLRRSAWSAGDRLFRCSICGRTLSPSRLEGIDAWLVCKDCVTVEDRDSTEASGGAVPPEAADAASDAVLPLLKNPLPKNMSASLTCPHCWHQFPPDQLLWVSEHAELVGDPVLGPDAQLRFRPSRFNAAGEAVDARDMACQLLACPRCHLEVPRAAIETRPLFVSIVGVPTSGKSHFIACMCWELRRILPTLGIAFNDADPFANQTLNGYEQTLFLQSDVTVPVAIRKTELQGDLYDRIRLGEQVVTLPRPFIFTLRPKDGPESGGKLRLLCMYDNAGEHFLPGMDLASAPATRHLARSHAIFFLFDPTQHPRFREACRPISDDPQLSAAAQNQRQEMTLTEAAARVRRYARLSPHKKHRRPLLVVVSKADIWAPLLDEDLETEPVWEGRPGGLAAGVDMLRIERISIRLRALLMKFTPEFVAAAEDFCQSVIYIPVSALGHAPMVQEHTGTLGVRPQDLKPRWVTAPMLYALAKAMRGLTPAPVPAVNAHGGESPRVR